MREPLQREGMLSVTCMFPKVAVATCQNWPALLYFPPWLFRILFHRMFIFFDTFFQLRDNASYSDSFLDFSF